MLPSYAASSFTLTSNLQEAGSYSILSRLKNVRVADDVQGHSPPQSPVPRNPIMETSAVIPSLNLNSIGPGASSLPFLSYSAATASLQRTVRREEEPYRERDSSVSRVQRCTTTARAKRRGSTTAPQQFYNSAQRRKDQDRKNDKGCSRDMGVPRVSLAPPPPRPRPPKYISLIPGEEPFHPNMLFILQMEIQRGFIGNIIEEMAMGKD